MKRTLFALTVCIILCFGLTVSTLALTLEQVQAFPPNFDVYVYGEGVDLSSVQAEDIKAELDGSQLRCTGVNQSEQGVFYVFMLDISASIPQAHFEAAKDAVISTYNSLRKQDKLAVITFGNEVNLLLCGDEDKSLVNSAISSLLCNDNQTMFYTAMDKLIETAASVRDMRRIAVVISDGIDDSDAGMTQSELEDKLVNCGISVYALCVDSSSQENIANFENFIRLSGGELFAFGPDIIQTVLEALPARLDDSLHIKLVSDQNIESGNELELCVQLGNLGSVSALLSSDKWIPDLTAPYIESAVFSIENKTLDIVFSEPVSGADNVSNYILTNMEGDTIPIGLSTYSTAEKATSKLSFDVLPVDGQYKLSVGGVFDISMEANELHPYVGTVTLATGIRDGGDTDNDNALSKDVIVYLLVGIVTIVLVVFLGTVIVRMSQTNNDSKGDKLSKEDKNKLKEVNNAHGPNKERFIFTSKFRDKNDSK